MQSVEQAVNKEALEHDDPLMHRFNGNILALMARKAR